MRSKRYSATSFDRIGFDVEQTAPLLLTPGPDHFFDDRIAQFGLVGKMVVEGTLRDPDKATGRRDR